MQIQGKTAISTGAASGMGLLLAQCFASEGGNVLMLDVNEPVLMEKAAEINAAGKGRAVGMVCDVRDYNQVCAARDRAVAEFGSIDLLCNFAGGNEIRVLQVDTQKYPEFCDIPMDVFDWGLDVNLRAQMYFDHAVFSQMREQKSGLIVNIGSITGEEGSAISVYAVAKTGAMYGLTKSIARAGAPHNIRCVCVSPGPVLTRPGMASMPTLVGRAAEPQELIDFILYLYSDKGAFINGTNIMVDGGRNAMGRG